MTVGIYLLHFEDVNEVYIGKSVDIHSRYLKHLAELRQDKHYNSKLQNLYYTHGTPNIMILEECKESELNNAEITWIKEFDSFKNGINRTPGGEGGISGEDSPTAKHTESTYLEILTLLATTDFTAEYIANIVGATKDIVAHISSGRSHIYLKDKYPELYQKMINRPAIVCAEYKYPKETYINALKLLASTDFSHIEIADQLGIPRGTVSQISYGTTHKYLQKEFPELYIIISSKRKALKYLVSPSGELHSFNKAKDFCELHGLSRGAVSSLLSGKLMQHKGWRKPNE